jgi:signal transduction histidine kinase
MKKHLEERLAFLGWGEADRQLLDALAPILDQHADRFVEAFYRHLLSFETTRELLRSPAVKERLLSKQREYLVSLGTTEIDDAYAQDRVAIGRVHERIGLAPRWYLGAYALYFSLLAPLVTESLRDDPTRAADSLVALIKRLLLDAQLAIESYNVQHEEQLEHLNRELAAASRSLAHEQKVTVEELRLTEHRARAAESLASVATLVAGLAHEIGTPMGVIRGHAEALEGSVEGEKAAWRLRTIREQIDRISLIIQSLLNIARPKQAQRVPVTLASVADTALAFLSEKVRRRSVRVERAFAPAPDVLGDADKLQQLFLNLILNALDAMPEGGTLRVAIAPSGDDEIEVSVADTGTGIAAADLPQIFTPFFSTKPAGRGSGLGLMVAEGIVSDHGGRIEAQSEVGRGTTFTMRFPGRPREVERPSSQ